MRISNNRKVYIYIACVTIAYLELIDIYFQADVIASNSLLKYCKFLVALLLAIIELVTIYAIVRGGIGSFWRIFMTRKVGTYILAFVFMLAFAVLMTVVCEYLDNTWDMIRVIVASSLIAIPNMLALFGMGLDQKKKEQ